MEKLEYCTNVRIEKKYGVGHIPPFDAISFFAALFAIRRLGISTTSGYSREIPWMRQTDPGRLSVNCPKIYSGSSGHV